MDTAIETTAVSPDTVLQTIESAAFAYGEAGDLATANLADLALAVLKAIPVDAAEPRKTAEFTVARDRAMAGFRRAFLARPRHRDDGTTYDLALCEAASASTVTDKEVRGWAKDDPRRDARKAVQGYARTRWMRALALAWPKAGDDAASGEAAGEAAPTAAPADADPTAALAGITAVLIGLSASKPAAALALLNGLDSLVKYARPYIAEGKAIPAT